MGQEKAFEVFAGIHDPLGTNDSLVIYQNGCGQLGDGEGQSQFS